MAARHQLEKHRIARVAASDEREVVRFLLHIIARARHHDDVAVVAVCDGLLYRYGRCKTAVEQLEAPKAHRLRHQRQGCRCPQRRQPVIAQKVGFVEEKRAAAVELGRAYLQPARAFEKRIKVKRQQLVRESAEDEIEIEYHPLLAQMRKAHVSLVLGVADENIVSAPRLTAYVIHGGQRTCRHACDVIYRDALAVQGGEHACGIRAAHTASLQHQSDRHDIPSCEDVVCINHFSTILLRCRVFLLILRKKLLTHS